MRLYFYDIRNILLDFLKNNLNNKLMELENKYNLNGVNIIKSFNYVLDPSFLPACIVWLDGSDLIAENSDVELVVEKYTGTIELVIKEVDLFKLQTILDSYEEAIKKILNYGIPDFTFIKILNVRKGYMELEKSGSVYAGLKVSFEIRVN